MGITVCSPSKGKYLHQHSFLFAFFFLSVQFGRVRSLFYLLSPAEMAVVLGNLAFVPDAASIVERRNRPVPFEVILNSPKREAPPSSYASFSSKILEFDGESWGFRVGKVKSKVNEVEFDSDEENGNGNGEDDEDESGDWEAMMRKRVKKLEETKELEKKAEELQGKMEEERRMLGIEETEEEKRMRVKRELEKLAKEQAERRATAKLMFDLGQKAYGRGRYGRAIEFFEAALTIIPGPTLYGGEIQIWLGMAYEANNRRTDCIELFLRLETSHPSVSIRRQASELRYIMQAPKIKITEEEMVSIPLIGNPYDNYAGTWSDKYKESERPFIGSTTNQLPMSRDYIGDILKWKPPADLEKNGVLWVSVALWLGLVGAALFLQK